jgi:signal transduction histidine kinase
LTPSKTYIQRFRLIGFLAALLILSGLELFVVPQNSATTENSSDLIDESLNRSANLFQDSYQEFKRESDELYSQVSQLALSDQNRSVILNRFRNYSFWGVSLHRENMRWVWDGYSLTPSPILLADFSDQLRVTLLKRNNVVYLFGQRSFTADGDTYHLLTAKKLEQTTNLPFADRVTYHLSDHPDLKEYYPVTFNFFNPVPESMPYRTLTTEFSDSVGVVYADPSHIEDFQTAAKANLDRWRTGIHLAMTLFLIILFISWCASARHQVILLTQLILPLILWLIFFRFNLAESWFYHIMIRDGIDFNRYQLLIEYGFHSLFLLLFLVPIIRITTLYRRRELTDQSHYQTLIYSLIFGASSAVLLLFYFHTTKSILIETDLTLLDLELAPDLPVFFFYILSAMFFTAVAGIITSLGVYLHGLEVDKSTVIGIASLFSFILFYYIIDLLLSFGTFMGAVFMTSLGVYIILLFTIHGIHQYPRHFLEMSGFRKVILSVFIISGSVYFIIWSSSGERLDRELDQSATAFAAEDIIDTQQILENLLFNLESDLIFLTGEDIRTRENIVQAQFQRAVQTRIRPDWRNHSFEIQLLDTNGNQISDYSTNLDSPGWRSLVNMTLMSQSYQGQQIRRATNRPIIWDRPSDLGEEYISFYRGWIPIYDETDASSIIAWIFAAAYLERPDYNKPIRSVLSAESERDWKQSIYIAEFTGGRVNRTAMEGIYQNQPQYNKLSEQEMEIAQRDSIAFITNITSRGSFREIIKKQDHDLVIKASTPLPGNNQHLFSFFRYHIVLIFFGLFIFAIFSTAGFQMFTLFGQSRKFKGRLLDGLTLATILFLTVLIFATQLALNRQNVNSVERELITKLNSLGESLRGEVDFIDTRSSTRLAEFSAPLNVDAFLYSGPNILDSTTPQIFQQYVIPRTMSYDVYNFLYNRERRHYITTTEVAGENLLIGYRTLLDENSLPAGAVAIPTFVESPVYQHQLLEVTSYLFAIYLVIFGLFIIGTVIFSNRLTKPLQMIQSGLSRISRGDLHTRVAVTGKDEIGSLARAYNEMAEKLEETRRELVKAEREAAWKEMAQQVAHEIKNPLTPMKLNLQHLQQRLEANPESVMELKPVIEKTARNIIDQIESLNKIASDFSKFAKPVQAAFEPTDLKQILTSVAELYDHDDTVFIQLTLPSIPITVSGAEDELRRVFINLVKNGIEASPDGSAKIDIVIRQLNSSAEVVIKDRGKGIAPEDQDRIFVPNFSTKSSGTGLGLAITKQIIEAHHGTIWFETDTENGTQFHVILPLA